MAILAFFLKDNLNEIFGGKKKVIYKLYFCFPTIKQVQEHSNIKFSLISLLLTVPKLIFVMCNILFPEICVCVFIHTVISTDMTTFGQFLLK